MNELTKRLFAEGWTRENHPNYVFWGTWGEGFEFVWDYQITLVWQTGCGLYVNGRSVGARDTCFMGVRYCPENGNPLIRCPYGRKDCEHVPAGFVFPWCPCQQSQASYDYDSSVEKLEKERARQEHSQWMEITGGQYCACVVGGNGYQGGRLQVEYDVDRCISVRCRNEYCCIRKRLRDLTKVNIFYDIRRTWVTRQGFLEDTKVELEKGVKVFSNPIARTDAEIWLKVKQAQHDPILSKHEISPKLTLLDHQQEHFSKYHRKWPGYDYFEFRYDVENIRIEARETRDLLQDLRDVAEGVEVIHAADLLKAKKQEKSDRKAARKEAKERKAKRRLADTIMTADDRTANALRREAERKLGAAETERLYKRRADEKAGIGEQMSLF